MNYSLFFYWIEASTNINDEKEKANVQLKFVDNIQIMNICYISFKPFL